MSDFARRQGGGQPITPSTHGAQFEASIAETTMNTTKERVAESVRIPVHGVELIGDLVVPDDALGVVIFAHGSGSGRKSPRNQSVARDLNERRFATLLLDLLTPDEVAIDEVTRHLRFDVGLLATRLVGVIDWTATRAAIAHLPLGVFGASTGAAAALVAAAGRPDQVSAVVSRGGRPDLVEKILGRVRAATLLIVGAEDQEVLALNEAAFHHLRPPKEMVLVSGASHLFEEAGTLEEVARLTIGWFEHHLPFDETVAPKSEPERVDEIC
jgi:pimeloyl-ACP methyl ester carboxylesterase